MEKETIILDSEENISANYVVALLWHDIPTDVTRYCHNSDTIVPQLCDDLIVGDIYLIRRLICESSPIYAIFSPGHFVG